METNINELKMQAENSAQYRFHELGEWIQHSWKPRIFYNHCIDCNMWVTINTDPMPNEIDIGGEVVALNCIRKYEKIRELNKE